MKKKILCINRQPPHGSIHAQEALDVALIGAAFNLHISLAFIDDGVYQLLRGQDPSAIGTKNFAAAFGALGDYDIHHIYVEAVSMQKRGLTLDDLIPVNWLDEADNDTEKPAITALDGESLRNLIDQQDILLSF